MHLHEEVDEELELIVDGIEVRHAEVVALRSLPDRFEAREALLHVAARRFEPTQGALGPRVAEAGVGERGGLSQGSEECER